MVEWGGVGGGGGECEQVLFVRFYSNGRPG